MISSGKRSELAVSKEKIKKYPYISQSKKSEKVLYPLKKKSLKKGLLDSLKKLYRELDGVF